MLASGCPGVRKPDFFPQYRIWIRAVDGNDFEVCKAMKTEDSKLASTDCHVERLSMALGVEKPVAEEKIKQWEAALKAERDAFAELAKNQSAIGRVWATGVAELVSKPGDDAGFARQALAKEFSINKITAEAKYGGVLERGYGPTADE